MVCQVCHNCFCVCGMVVMSCGGWVFVSVVCSCIIQYNLISHVAGHLYFPGIEMLYKNEIAVP